MTRMRRQLQTTTARREANISHPQARALFAVSSACAILVVACLVIYLDDASLEMVRRINMSQSDGSAYREIVEWRKPVVLTSTVADRWKASKWTSKFLSWKLPHILAYRQELDPVFMTFHDGKPLEHLVNEYWKDFNEKVNVTIPELLHWQVSGGNHDKNDDNFLYFSQDISLLRDWFPDIVSHTMPINDLVVSEGGIQVNLWIGRAGITTHMHYDAMYNFFYQIQGQKRFTLLPPTSCLYLYPCLHPHYGHSQVDIMAPDMKKFPLFNRSAEVVIVVHPGELLVVPPFWFHHVETLQESVSLNVWSDASEYILMNNIYSKPVPLELEWLFERRVQATRLYSHLLLKALGIQSDDFIQKLFFTRYFPLYGYDSARANLRVNETFTLEMRAICDTNWSVRVLQRDVLSESDVSRCLGGIVPLFMAMSDRAILEVLLANYLEHLVHVCVGLDQVYSFFQVCQVTGLD